MRKTKIISTRRRGNKVFGHTYDVATNEVGGDFVIDQFPQGHGRGYVVGKRYGSMITKTRTLRGAKKAIQEFRL